MKNKELPTSKKIGKEIIGIVVSIPVIFGFVIYEFDDAKMALFVCAAYIVGSAIYYFFYFGKPVAWIVDQKLYINEYPLNKTPIQLDVIESITYDPRYEDKSRQGYTESHRITVKMVGFSLWEIPITNQFDHIRDMRLYKFLKDNIPQLELKK